MKHLAIAFSVLAASCGDSTSTPADGASMADGPPMTDGASVDGAPSADAAPALSLGTISGVMPLSRCPSGAPMGSTCQQITVSGCPGIENESLDATITVLAPSAARRGTVVHFKGGGGEGYEGTGVQQYAAAGLLQVFVSWPTDWELTAASGIKTAACRPATVLKWIFDQPDLHGGNRTLAFCGQGFSAGSAQLGYALAQYGMADYLDYVNELSGPPFSRLDLGCDGNAPATAQVCGADDTMRLPAFVNPWLHLEAPNACGSTTLSPSEIAELMNDSILVGGIYSYPHTRVQFFVCTYRATAVSAMAQLYYQQIMSAEGGTDNVAFNCYSQSDGCGGEGLGSGEQAAIAAMMTGCMPRHQ